MIADASPIVVAVVTVRDWVADSFDAGSDSRLVQKS